MNNRSSRIIGCVIAWDFPSAAMLLAIGMDSLPKTLTWVAAFGWMGMACQMNARRCGSSHCYFSGPFFLLMMVPTAFHGFSVVSLGPDGWRWLGMTIGIGGGSLWCLTESVLGKLQRP